MTRLSGLAPHPRSSRLFIETSEDRLSLWTAALGVPPSLHGEPVRAVRGTRVRRWDPSRSKLAAGLVRGYEGTLPKVGQRWLYLGAAAGTTASHVADLVGPSGVVVAVEPSPRTFVRLLAVAQRYPNVWPVLADAHRPQDYSGLVPPVDGVYCDVAQPDQVDLLLDNAAVFLREGGALILALKTASMGRGPTPEDHLAQARRALGAAFHLAPPVRLDPIHRRHYLLGTAEEPEAGRRPSRTARPPRGRRDKRRL